MMITLGSYAQVQVQRSTWNGNQSKGMRTSSIDTLLPEYLGDSCISTSTYYLLNDKILSGAAVLSDGTGINKVAQLFDTGSDSIRIGSLSIELVYVDLDSGKGQIVAGIYAEQDLLLPLGETLPVSTSLLTDTSYATSINDLFFADPVKVQGKFWVVLDVVNAGDSIYVASTNYDCGARTAIFQKGQTWLYYKDQFMVNNDPVDIALKMAVVMERIVDADELGFEKPSVFAYPNPASSYLKLQLPDTELLAQVKLYSTTGSISFEENNYRSGDHLSLSDMPPGIYLITIEQGSIHYSSKVVLRP